MIDGLRYKMDSYPILSRLSSNFLFLILICTLAGSISVFLGADDSGDMRNYHFYNGYIFLSGLESRDVTAAGLQTYYNPVLDVPFYTLNHAFPNAPRFVAFAMGLPYGVLTFLTLRIAMLVFGQGEAGSLSSLLATLFGATATAGGSQIGLSTNEIPVAVLILAALLFLLYAIKEKTYGFSRFVILAGLFAGLAVGGKLTAASYGVSIVIATMMAVPPSKIVATVFAIGIAEAVGFAIAGGFWIIHLYVQFGNPIFPYHNDLFHSPWAINSDYVDNRFFADSLVQEVFYPFWWALVNSWRVTEYPFADARFAALFSMAAISVGCYVLQPLGNRAMPSRPWRALVVFWVMGYYLWLTTFSIYRYTVPLETIGGILFVGGVRYVFKGLQMTALATASLIITIMICTTVYPNWGRIAYQTRTIPVRIPPLPENSLVVMVGNYPMSYVAALTPKSIRYVGAYNNFNNPKTRTLTRDRIRDIINGWTGPIEVLETRTYDQEAQSELKVFFHLEIASDCQIIRSAWDQDALQFCAARHDI